MPFVDIFKPPMCKISIRTLWCRNGQREGGMVGESHSSHWLKWKADPLVSRDRNSRGYPKYHLPTLKNSQVNHWISNQIYSKQNMHLHFSLVSISPFLFPVNMQQGLSQFLYIPTEMRSGTTEDDLSGWWKTRKGTCMLSSHLTKTVPINLPRIERPQSS